MEVCLYKGKQICAYDVTNENFALNYELKKEWRIAGRNGELICEECGKEVHLRVNDPRKKTPHFSHKSTDDKCPFSNNDLRESEEHKRGKILLYHYFKCMYPSVTPMINYRFVNRRKADLYIEFNNGDKLAIEYQRTELDIVEWKDRQEQYIKANINALWLISGNEESVLFKEKQIEMTFFQQIMLNELDKVAVYLDVNNSKLIFAKNIRFSDPFVTNNDYEELFIKSYNLRDVVIHTNGKIECDFIEEYKKAAKVFADYYYKKCLEEEKCRIKIKEEKMEWREQLREIRSEKTNNYSSENEIKPKTKSKIEASKYVEGNRPYKRLLKNIINGNESESTVKEIARYLREPGDSDDLKIITSICKFHYLKGSKLAKEVYDKIISESGFKGENFEEVDVKKQMECPFCKGNLVNKFGRYGAFVSCSNHPQCKFSFNI